MSSNPSRRHLLAAGIPAIAGALACTAPREATSAEPAGIPWPTRRKSIERAWLDLLGDFPRQAPPLNPVTREVSKEHGITRHHVSFQAEPDDRVTAWLLVPDSALQRPAPAIICIHSTTWGAGKNSTAGLSGRRLIDPPDPPAVGRASGLLLAQHGYVTLCIDLLTDGERIKPDQRVMDTRDFYLRYPDWSIVGKNIWDVMRSIDYLQTLEFVNPKQIGCTGWSLGGHSALFAAAFDDRITATVTNGGVLDWHRNSTHWSRTPASWTPWKKGDPESSSPEIERRFGFQTNSGPYIYIKRFKPYLDDPALPLPVDFDSLMMLAAPRPLLVLSSEWEFYSHKIVPKCAAALEVYANWQDAAGLPSALAARQQRAGYDRTAEYYEFHHKVSPARLPGMLAQVGAGDCLSWFSFPGGHSYPPVAQQLSFAWFDRWLGHDPA